MKIDTLLALVAGLCGCSTAVVVEAWAPKAHHGRLAREWERFNAFLRGNNVTASLVVPCLEVLVLLLGTNCAIEKYADFKTSEMAKIVLEETPSLDTRSTIHQEKIPPPKVWQPSQLRSTIHPRSGLVENLNHRRAWNRWLMATSLSSRDDTVEFLNPGEYTFAYRSYVDYEEAGGIRKRLFHLPTLLWGYVQPARGTMTVSAALDDNDTPGKVTDTESPVQKVSLEEVIRFGWFTLLCIQWYGHWDPETSSIQWTESKLTIHRRKNLMRYCQWWKYWRPISLAETQIDNSEVSSVTTEVVSRPEKSEELRKIPWQVIKEEDGMIALRRGDVGMLVYDKTAKVN
jgi:hypothetical protein